MLSNSLCDWSLAKARRSTHSNQKQQTGVREEEKQQDAIGIVGMGWFPSLSFIDPTPLCLEIERDGDDGKERRSTVLDLPIELLLDIAHRLRPRTLAHMASTCRAFYDIAMDDALWCHLVHADYGGACVLGEYVTADDLTAFLGGRSWRWLYRARVTSVTRHKALEQLDQPIIGMWRPYKAIACLPNTFRHISLLKGRKTVVVPETGSLAPVHHPPDDYQIDPRLMMGSLYMGERSRGGLPHGSGILLVLAVGAIGVLWAMGTWDKGHITGHARIVVRTAGIPYRSCGLSPTMYGHVGPARSPLHAVVVYQGECFRGRPHGEGILMGVRSDEMRPLSVGIPVLGARPHTERWATDRHHDRLEWARQHRSHQANEPFDFYADPRPTYGAWRRARSSWASGGWVSPSTVCAATMH